MGDAGAAPLAAVGHGGAQRGDTGARSGEREPTGRRATGTDRRDTIVMPLVRAKLRRVV
ncbi:hypothetical protein ACFPM0_05320 [Pseudonocardia sulfidoxydans]|uniref:hypothetical protein n=1 Tax=Pseudonocardia sulfidoxydans TaxID=54011 RepID=UPI0036162A40